MIQLKNLVIPLLSILLVSLCFAQDLQLSADMLTHIKGFPFESARPIVQDKEGFLWISTYQGLARDDGYKFKIYTHDANDSTSLSNNEISSL